jgi:hypothetical protein
MVHSYSDPAVAAFVVIPAFLVIALVWGTAISWRPGMAAIVGGIAAIWMTVTWALAQSGILRNWEQNPPPFGLLVVAVVLLSAAIAFSQLGRRLALSVPLWTLVAVQSFRLPLELAMHTIMNAGLCRQR